MAALRVERVRDFGEAWLGLALSHRLGLHTLLAALIDPARRSAVAGHRGGAHDGAFLCATQRAGHRGALV